MRYKNPELQELLASEYALGSLTTLVRKRLEKLITLEPELNKKVCQWEERLYPLADSLQPVQPGENVWRAIDAQIKPKAKKESLWNNLLFLRSFSSAAFALVLTMSVLLNYQIDVEPVESISRGASYIAVMLDENNKPGMVINTYRKPLQLSVSLLDDTQLSADKELHLWAITKQTREIHSLGVLTGEKHSMRALLKSEWQFLKYSRELFITEEALNSSPMKPSGKTVFKGTCSLYK
jgi:anti-sigma-K factor RskA